MSYHDGRKQDHERGIYSLLRSAASGSSYRCGLTVALRTIGDLLMLPAGAGGGGCDGGKGSPPMPTRRTSDHGRQLREALAPYLDVRKLRAIVANGGDLQQAFHRERPGDLPDEAGLLIDALGALLRPDPLTAEMLEAFGWKPLEGTLVHGSGFRRGRGRMGTGRRPITDQGRSACPSKRTRTAGIASRSRGTGSPTGPNTTRACAPAAA